MTSPEAIEILLSLSVALAAGFLVGAERQQSGHTSFGGVRTFPLVALSGAIGMLLGWPALAVMGATVGGLLIVAHIRDSAQAKEAGVSSEVAAVVTFGLGAMCTARELGLDLRTRLVVAAASATVTLALLTIKQPLHRWIGKIRSEEVLATAKLLILAVIILPLLPNEALGPWDALNPRSIGMLAVLINSIDFAGYAAIRIFGAHRGVVLTGVFGGLVSSTAVTLAFAGRAVSHPAMTLAWAVAIVLASATLFFRVVVELAVVSPRLALAALGPFLTAGLVAALSGAMLYRHLSRDAVEAEVAAELALDNPFSIWSALKFALLYVIILLMSHGAVHHFADVGVYVSAALAGLADVDAISLSIARMYEKQSIGDRVALTGLAIAATSNTLTKLVMCAALGSRALTIHVSRSLLAGLVAGAVVLLLTQLV